MRLPLESCYPILNDLKHHYGNQVYLFLWTATGGQLRSSWPTVPLSKLRTNSDGVRRCIISSGVSLRGQPGGKPFEDCSRRIQATKEIPIEVSKAYNRNNSAAHEAWSTTGSWRSKEGNA